MDKKFLLLILGILLIGIVSATNVIENNTFIPNQVAVADTIPAGMRISTNSIPIILNSVNKMPLGNSTVAYLLWNDSQTILARAVVVGNTFIFNYPLNANQNYSIVSNASSGTVKPVYNNTAITALPIVGTYLNWTAGVSGIGLPSITYSSAFNILSANVTSNNKSFTTNSVNFNLNTTEMSTENFTINLTAISQDNIRADFIYNGVNYGSAGKSNDSLNVMFSKKIQIPLITNSPLGTFYWNITYTNSSLIEQTDYYYQTDSILSFGICSANLTTNYLNYTFRDESNSSLINASIPYSNFTYFIGDGTLIKSKTFVSTVENPSYSFCFSPNNSTINVTSFVQYASTNYPQRTLTESYSLSNITTNKTLYLLSSTDGIYVTFQVINQAEQPISEVNVVGTRAISGLTTIIAQGLTDSSGSVTFWLNPDFSHIFNFTKTGFDLFTTSLFPTQSSYTISLIGGGVVSGQDYSKGISYSINPKATQVLNNNTLYNFNYTISSSLWTISEFGFTLTNSSGFIFNTTSLSANGGTLNVGLNVGNNSYLTMNYYYIINSTYTNASTIWKIWNSYGSGHSINSFFSDLSLYISSGSGLFGIDNFALNIIIFLIILLTTGILSYQYGISSPASIMGVIFGLVFFFDVVLGLVSSPIAAIPHLPTFLVAFIFIILIIREGMK